MQLGSVKVLYTLTVLACAHKLLSCTHQGHSNAPWTSPTQTVLEAPLPASVLPGGGCSMPMPHTCMHHPYMHHPCLELHPFCLQDGVTPVGVSLAFTVRAMDAGPVLDTELVRPADNWQAPQMLDHLFSCGTQ